MELCINKKNNPLLSVVCPVLNEEFYIENVLHFFINSNPKSKELFIIDGLSQDNTSLIVAKWAEKYSNIKLLQNPERFVPHALNIAIPLCKGDYIVRLDAHTDYSIDYFEKIITTFEKTNADIVGGPMRPKGLTSFQKAVANTTSNKFGVGDSKFHDENHEGYVDSVYLGAWKKELFEDVGFFDEDLVRNQDDEFHYRAKSKGKKIYLNPDITSYYYPRKSFKSLFKQYYQYGLYKPLVLKKVMTEIKSRHIVPTMFVIYLTSIPFTVLVNHLFIIPLLLYLALCLYNSLLIKANLLTKAFSYLVYPTIHIAYGIGFIRGLIKFYDSK